jgi:uncharacterized protein YecT (DUF1311 family)
MRNYLLPLLLLLPISAQAQDTKVHPIDKFFESCTDKNPSTAGMVDCTSRAYKMWDQELNKNYLSLMRKLKPDAKQTLKAAQLEWIKYRDTEFKLIDSIYAMLEGTMYIPMHAEQQMDIVKQRALVLATYLDLTGEAEP